MSSRLTLLALALCAACSSPAPAPVPLPCLAVPAQTDAGLPADTVWGFADLHAHPAIEKAFNGALIWGSAVDDAPVNGSELPRIAGCPVETHTQPGVSPIDRAIGAQVFPAVSQIAGFAHAPVGSLGYRATPAWPNARDVIHQQMNVGSIRRAYEGGLRLMFAATTDDQVIAALLTGPNMVNAFIPKAPADFESARRQLELIEKIAADNPTWIGIARTPADARRIILSGRLALVLSIEMNGFRDGEIEQLHDDYGVRHMFPIHLIDNNFGGTAAATPLFNSASAAVSSLYREDHLPMQFMDLIATRDFPSPLGRPQTFATLKPVPVYVGLDEVQYLTYQKLCYEPLSACSSPVAAPTSFLQFGQQNLRGLCTDAAECLDGGHSGVGRVSKLMDDRWLIDASHMSARSVTETIGVRAGYPLIASHGDIVHLCSGNPTLPPCVDSAPGPLSERQLDGEAAREIVRRQGVLGLGVGTGNYGARALVVARGAPLFILDPSGGASTACAAQDSDTGVPTDSCAPALRLDGVDAGTLLRTLQVDAVGGVPGNSYNARPFVRVELRDPVDPHEFQRRVVVAPLDCTVQACGASVDLGTRDAPTTPPVSACTAVSPTDAGSCPDGGSCGTAWSVDDLESVTVQWLYLECDAKCQQAGGNAGRQCAATWEDARAPRWSITALELSAPQADAGSICLASFGPRGGAPLATLQGKNGTFPLYQRSDGASVSPPVKATGHLLKVSVTAGASGKTLPGAGSAQAGAQICAAVRKRVGGECVAAPPPAPGSVDCPGADGWISINQRGAWNPGVTLFGFVRSAEDERDVCGLDLKVLDWSRSNPPFTIDSIRIEAIEDPVGHWVRRYAEVARHVADGGMGVIALGTDFNGLNGMIDISERPLPPAARAPSACPVTSGGPAPSTIAPLRLRNHDGTLAEEVRIDERGLATYGLLADFVAIVEAYPGCGGDVRDSLMLSAEATLRAWEKVVDPTAPPRPPLPTRPFLCALPPGVGP